MIAYLMMTTCLDAIEVVGFSTDEQQELRRILAAVLFLCNIDFEENDDEEAHVANRDPLLTAAATLEVC